MVSLSLPDVCKAALSRMEAGEMATTLREPTV